MESKFEELISKMELPKVVFETLKNYILEE
jgi:hypothetical protein